MPQTRLYLHIGAGKCGSSSIQKALTQHPEHPGMPVYAKFNGQGDVRVCPPGSKQRGVTASAHVTALTEETWRALRGNILTRTGERGPLLFSYEGWHNQAAQFLRHGGFDFCAPVTVIYYIRPPVDYVNSAWWQWGAWKNWTFEKAVRRFTDHARWADHARAWKSMPGIDRLIVRPLPKDAVSDFYGLFGVEAPELPRVNQTLPGSVLRLFQQRPELWKHRRGDLTEAFDRSDPAPWVLPPDAVSYILGMTQESTLGLQSFMDEDTWSRIENDPRWWTPSAYSTKEVEDPFSGPVKNAERAALDLLAYVCRQNH